MSAHSSPATVAAFGVIGGVVLMGLFSGKPAPVYAAPAPVTVAAPAPAPVAAIDYAAITAAVKAGMVRPAPVADSAPVKRKVRKVHHAAAPAARLVYFVPAYSGCTCHL